MLDVRLPPAKAKAFSRSGHINAVGWKKGGTNVFATGDANGKVLVWDVAARGSIQVSEHQPARHNMCHDGAVRVR